MSADRVPSAARSVSDQRLIARRTDFPALETFVWFQNGGVSLIPRPVNETHLAQADAAFLRGPLHIAYPDEEYPRRDASRARIARFLGADLSEIAIVRGVSEAFHDVLRGIDWSAGDELVITADEEGALLVPALQLKQDRGVRVRMIPLPTAADPMEILSATEAILGKRTRLVAISHVTTDWGVRLPVTAICAAAESRGIPTFVDLAHSAGTMPVDVHAIGCSYAGALSYKWMLSPYAAGVLFVRGDRLSSLPVMHAGNRAEARLDYAGMTMELQPGARRFEYGPWSWPLVHAWAAALDYVDDLGVKKIEARAAALTNRLKAGLANISGAAVYTPLDPGRSAALVGFGLAGWTGPELERGLRDRFNIVVRSLVNVRDGVRASVAFFTLESEVDFLLDAVRALATDPPDARR